MQVKHWAFFWGLIAGIIVWQLYATMRVRKS